MRRPPHNFKRDCDGIGALPLNWVECEKSWALTKPLEPGLNLSLRQRVAAMGRRSATPCKREEGLRQQLSLFQAYHNFVLPHASLRQALAEPVATHGKGSAKVWRPRTPAMAAGLTDHVWSLREVLLFRVPPWPQPQTV